MKILVTGSAGFIGFNLANSLLDEGHEVVGVDNFNDYYSVKLKRARHALLEKQAGYSGCESDICDVDVIKKLFVKYKFDRVCHLAAQPGIRYSLQHPFLYQKSNVQGFLTILEACRAAETPRLVYASSSSVYGGNRRLPFCESDVVDSPISLYAATKKANELMAHVYTHLYGIQMIGLRLFTVYGPWGRPDMALWLFTEAMLKGEPIQVFNHGKMRRDFAYIDDITAGIRSALFTEGLDQYDLFNLGNHQPEQLMDLINTIAGALGVQPKMELQPIQPGDLVETYADIEKARKKLHFNPCTRISEGIPRFVNWYRQYHGLMRNG